MTTRLAVAMLLVITIEASAQPLVTPVRVGRSDAPMKLTVWAQQDYSHLAARNPDIAPVFNDLFEQWARTHPGVQLEISVMPAFEQYKAKLMLAARARRLPDIASIDSFWLPLFLEDGLLQPLNDHWPEADRADFMPFTIGAMSDARNQIYGLWHETDCRALFYRRDLVPSPPATWEELLATAAKVSREHRIAGYLYNGGRWEGTTFDNLAMFWGQGGELVDAETRPVFGQPPHREYMVELLRFLRDTVKSGAAPRSVLAINDYAQLTSAAIAGDVAMFLGGNWQLTDLQGALTKEQFAQWDIAPIPQRVRGARSTGTGGWVWSVFARDSAKQAAAIEFLRFLEAPANAARISAATGHLPVRRSVYRDVAFFREDRWFARFADMLVYGKARPAAPIYPFISERLQLAIGDAVSEAKTPEAALDEAWSAVVAEDARQRARSSARTASFDPIALAPSAIAILLPAAALWTLRGRHRTLIPWLAPALALTGAVLLYPMLDLLRLSFTNARTAGGGYTYTLDSFTAVLQDSAFPGMVAVTLVFVAVSVALQLGLGLAIAMFIEGARRSGAHRGTLAARVAVLSAWIVPGVLVGLLWKILLVENRSGIANYALSLAGLGPLPFLSSGTLALASVIAANTWRGCAFSMILQYAGLQRIPRELHEAADLEGLTGWPRFATVVLPQIAPVVMLNLILITIYTLNTFDLILPLTGGGPARQTEVVSLYMYRSAFFDLEAGRAAAVAVVTLAINVTLASLALRMMRGRTA